MKNKGGKCMKGFATIFKEVFSEGLEPYGFKKIKGRQPYIVRCINDEIVHVITYRPMWSFERGYKEFCIYSGISTIYRGKINFVISPYNNSWITGMYTIYKKQNKYKENKFDVYFSKKYNPKDENSMYIAAKAGLEKTKEIILPELENAKTIRGVIDYISKYQEGLYLMEKGCNAHYKEKECNEGLLFLKEFTYEQYEKFEKELMEYNYEMYRCLAETGKSHMTIEKLGESKERYKIHLGERLEKFKKMTTDPEEIAWVKEELERRIKLNTKILKKHNII